MIDPRDEGPFDLVEAIGVLLLIGILILWALAPDAKGHPANKHPHAHPHSGEAHSTLPSWEKRGRVSSALFPAPACHHPQLNNAPKDNEPNIHQQP